MSTYSFRGVDLNPNTSYKYLDWKDKRVPMSKPSTARLLYPGDNTTPASAWKVTDFKVPPEKGYTALMPIDVTNRCCKKEVCNVDCLVADISK